MNAHFRCSHAQKTTNFAGLTRRVLINKPRKLVRKYRWFRGRSYSKPIADFVKAIKTNFSRRLNLKILSEFDSSFKTSIFQEQYEKFCFLHRWKSRNSQWFLNRSKKSHFPFKKYQKKKLDFFDKMRKIRLVGLFLRHPKYRDLSIFKHRDHWSRGESNVVNQYGISFLSLLSQF